MPNDAAIPTYISVGALATSYQKSGVTKHPDQRNSHIANARLPTGLIGCDLFSAECRQLVCSAYEDRETAAITWQTYEANANPDAMSETS